MSFFEKNQKKDFILLVTIFIFFSTFTIFYFRYSEKLLFDRFNYFLSSDNNKENKKELPSKSKYKSLKKYLFVPLEKIFIFVFTVLIIITIVISVKEKIFPSPKKEKKRLDYGDNDNYFKEFFLSGLEAILEKIYSHFGNGYKKFEIKIKMSETAENKRIINDKIRDNIKYFLNKIKKKTQEDKEFQMKLINSFKQHYHKNADNLSPEFFETNNLFLKKTSSNLNYRNNILLTFLVLTIDFIYKYDYFANDGNNNIDNFDDLFKHFDNHFKVALSSIREIVSENIVKKEKNCNQYDLSWKEYRKKYGTYNLLLYFFTDFSRCRNNDDNEFFKKEFLDSSKRKLFCFKFKYQDIIELIKQFFVHNSLENKKHSADKSEGNKGTRPEESKEKNAESKNKSGPGESDPNSTGNQN